MIIDSHVHLVDEGWIHRDFFLGMARMAAAMVGKETGHSADPEAIVDNLLPILTDPGGDKLIESMDKVGIDKCCIFAVDYELATGQVTVPIEEQNLAIVKAANKYPDRLIPFFTIDPRRQNSAQIFERFITEHGVRGLKLHPTSGFFPYEKCCYPLYEKCLEYHLPVLFHTGSQPAPLKFRFSQPVMVDDVAADFPELKIVMAHVGHDLYKEALLVASVKTNIYFDISGWQIRYRSRPADFYRMLRTVLDEVGPWRVFFGTDGPYLNVIVPPDQWLKAVLEPDVSSCPEIEFSREELEIIAGKALSRFLGLEDIPHKSTQSGNPEENKSIQ